MRTTKQPALWNPETEEYDQPLPHKWEICEDCRGEGKSSAYLGAFTAEQMREDDPDFAQDYMDGFYDRACEHCGGSGKVAVPDFKRLTPAQKKAWKEQARQEAEDRAIDASERFMDPDYLNEIKGW